MAHDHEHPHDHSHGHGHGPGGHTHGPSDAAGTWRDPQTDDPLSVSRRAFLAGSALVAGAVAGLGGAAAGLGQGVAAAAPGMTPTNPWSGNNRFYAGDHHIHTQYSPDAQYTVETQVTKAQQYGLSWVVITDHGSVAHQKFSIDQVTPNIEASRAAHRDMLVYQGLEWNIPGAEHATVFMPPGRNTVDILKAFELAYDGAVLASNGAIPGATSGLGEPYALQALQYLDQQVRQGRTEVALMFANHPARRGIDSPHEIRNWRDSAPSVAVGMEGAPGHQAAGIPLPQGSGRARGYYDFAPTTDSFPGYAPTATENPSRPYGGDDWLTAQVGGLWDSLLAEGLPWWITSTSDSHQVYRDTFTPGTQNYDTTGSRGAPVDTRTPITTYGDFWPGQYSSTLVAAQSRAYVDVMRGLQSGQVVAVHGRLIDGLDVRVRAFRGDGDRRGVTLGGRTWIARGGDVKLDVTIDLAAGPNFNGQVPALAKVDLISGPVTGRVTDKDTLSAPGTTVVKTFDVSSSAGGRRVRLDHTFTNVQQSFYLRLRGSDGKQLDAAGNPLMDVGGNEDPFADLWFYANPVFVDVV